MILSLSVRNHGPFLEESVLLMEASGCSEHPYNRMGTASVRNGVLTSAAMFGPSGSGRSSFMSAATALRDLVLGIFPRGYPFYNPFLSSGDPTVICLRAAVGRNRYEYSVSFDADSVVSETLYSFPSGRRNIVFDRRTGKGTDDGILSCLPPSVTYLKAAADAGSEECSDIVSEMSSYDFMSQQDDPEETVERYLDADPGLAPRIGALMERLDTGVDGLMIAGPRAGMVLTHPLTGGGGRHSFFRKRHTA